MSATSRARRIGLAVGALAIAAAVATAARPAAHAAPTAAPSTADSSEAAPPDLWLKGLTGAHRQLFDTPDVGGGVPLVHVMNYYDTYNRSYDVADADIDAVVTLYGGTTLYAVNDAAWAKYRIGELLKANDPGTGAPAIANPWRAKPVIMGSEMPAASIEALQRRGATFIVCNNALTVFSGVIARARGLEPAAVHADLQANILPGVELVPGMVVAIEQAHRAGLSYLRH